MEVVRFKITIMISDDLNDVAYCLLIFSCFYPYLYSGSLAKRQGVRIHLEMALSCTLLELLLSFI